MTDADGLRAAFVALEVNDDFTQASLTLRYEGRMHFVHRVGERTVRAEGTLASEVLAKIVKFRLNAKHLDIEFADSSRWETAFAAHK
jgi:hypothetical protein